MDIGGRRQQRGRIGRPGVGVANRPAKPDLALHRAVREQRQNRDHEQQHARHVQVAQPLQRRDRLAERDSPQQEQADAHRREDGAVAARPDLQREESAGPPQLSPISRVEVLVEKGEREGNPLHPADVYLGETEEPRRGEREDQAAEERRGGAETHPPHEDVGAGPAQHAGQQRRDIERQHRVAGREQHRGHEQAGADDVLGVREGVAQRVVDVRVENRQRIRHEGMHVPRDEPQEQVRVGAQTEHGARGGRSRTET